MANGLSSSDLVFSFKLMPSASHHRRERARRLATTGHFGAAWLRKRSRCTRMRHPPSSTTLLTFASTFTFPAEQAAVTSQAETGRSLSYAGVGETSCRQTDL